MEEVGRGVGLRWVTEKDMVGNWEHSNGIIHYRLLVLLVTNDIE